MVNYTNLFMFQEANNLIEDDTRGYSYAGDLDEEAHVDEPDDVVEAVGVDQPEV